MRKFFLGAVQAHGPADYLILEDERYTYAQTFEAASRAASIFRDVYDVHKGDRVGIVMRNYPQVRGFYNPICAGHRGVSVLSSRPIDVC